jgi:hypothetical protein
MDVLGKRDQDGVDKLLAAKAAMEAAGLPVPEAIAEKLGEGYEEKSPNELRTAILPPAAVRFHQEGDRTGVMILLDNVPAEIRELVVFPLLKTDDSPSKPESTSTEPSESSLEDKPEEAPDPNDHVAMQAFLAKKKADADAMEETPTRDHLKLNDQA